MARLKFIISAGVLVADQIRLEILDYLFQADLEYVYESDRSFLTRTYRFTLTGDAEKIQQAWKDLRKWVKENEGELLE